MPSPPIAAASRFIALVRSLGWKVGTCGSGGCPSGLKESRAHERGAQLCPIYATRLQRSTWPQAAQRRGRGCPPGCLRSRTLAMARTTSMPAMTRPHTMFMPSRRGTGPARGGSRQGVADAQVSRSSSLRQQAAPQARRTPEHLQPGSSRAAETAWQLGSRPGSSSGSPGPVVIRNSSGLYPGRSLTGSSSSFSVATTRGGAAGCQLQAQHRDRQVHHALQDRAAGCGSAAAAAAASQQASPRAACRHAHLRGSATPCPGRGAAA